MDPGEPFTGTRDEQYDLIAVLYHALQGAYACDTYALDAEAAGCADLIGYFQEARTAYVRVAARAKGMLGIPEVIPEPEVAPAWDASSGVPEVVTSQIAPGDFESTNAVPRSGVEGLTLERALEEIDNRELKLEESNDPELAPIAENLRQLRYLLTGDVLDRAAIGGSMIVLSEQVWEVASGELRAGVAGEKRQLGELLDAGGRTVSEEV
jgi:hypothetical protein